MHERLAAGGLRRARASESAVGEGLKALLQLADRIAAGQSITGLALECALWCRYCAGVSDSGAEIAPNDPNWDRLQPVAQEAKARPQAWLEMRDIYGDLGSDPVFAAAFANALTALWSEGTAAVLTRYVEDTL